MIEFGIADSADQKFSAVVSGRRISVRLRFNHFSSRWSFDLSIDGNAVLHGRRIVNNIDLIEPFGFGIGVIFAFSAKGHTPGRDELVDGRVKLYSATNEEVANAVAT